MDWLRLIGIVIVVIGLALRLRVAVVVVAAGLATGLAAHMPIVDGANGTLGIVSVLGKAFAENRIVTLFVLSLPALGLAERYGLQERADAIIASVRAASAGRL